LHIIIDPVQFDRLPRLAGGIGRHAARIVLENPILITGGILTVSLKRIITHQLLPDSQRFTLSTFPFRRFSRHHIIIGPPLENIGVCKGCIHRPDRTGKSIRPLQSSRPFDTIAARISRTTPAQDNLTAAPVGLQTAGGGPGGDRFPRKRERTMTKPVHLRRMITRIRPPLRTHPFRSSLRIRRRQPFDIHIMIVGHLMKNTQRPPTRLGHRLRITQIRIPMIDPRHIIPQIPLGDILQRPQHAVVVISPQIITLIPRRLTKHRHRIPPAQIVSLVSSHFFRLGQPVRMNIPRSPLNPPVARSVFEEIQRLLINSPIIAKHPNRRHRSHIARVPIQPVMGVAPLAPESIMMPPQKIKIGRIKHPHHHILVGLPARLVPAGIRTEQITGNSKQVSANPRSGERFVSPLTPAKSDHTFAMAAARSA